ncbi:hypothetical protein JOB18_029501 [Solea senegalensis]|uniref:Uncharacterized protein n=2 Tax=Solea senegalensis TaxID=28829 RepID=A0AAV6S9J3_SOLSE|nr:hypothetical protein JOB18_029501 [Solea senegalensis]
MQETAASRNTATTKPRGRRGHSASDLQRRHTGELRGARRNKSFKPQRFSNPENGRVSSETQRQCELKLEKSASIQRSSPASAEHTR